MQDDDFSLFKSEMRGVKRISVDRADTGKPRNDRQQLKQRQPMPACATTKSASMACPTSSSSTSAPRTSLSWARDGVQESQLRKLKQGLVPFDGSLDLHGMSVEKARQTLWDFLAEATRLEIRCVRVTHGKAARKDGRSPLVKSHVNTWLRQHPQVLGFTSCLPRHGGTGSVYVMLRRTMLEGRDE